MTRLAAVWFFSALTWGQCAMCFRTAESQTRARAAVLNQGIAILLLPVAASAGAIALLAYRRRARVIGTGGCRDCPAAGDA